MLQNVTLRKTILRVTANVRNTLYNKRSWHSKIRKFVWNSWLILLGNTHTEKLAVTIWSS